MTERQIPCPRCRQENPPSNRFCGSCGAPLTSSEQLATRQEHRPVPAGRAWPAKLGPVSKALAVGVAALATEAGLSWLRHRMGAEDRPAMPAVRGVDSPSCGYLVGQRSLEAVLLQRWEDSHGQFVVRRDVRSFVVTGSTGRRR
jgi:Double zinc ribbon